MKISRKNQKPKFETGIEQQIDAMGVENYILIMNCE